ncbi:MAG TPA: hypothetical protein VEB86_07625, partial [Chryseosolibacter sp.]|nr:hypothetical protein [Chryseosolibacter sp.]
MNQKTLFLAGIIFSASCAGNQKESLQPESQASVEAVSNGTATVHDPYSSGTDRVIKTANYRFEVKNAREASEKIQYA